VGGGKFPVFLRKLNTACPFSPTFQIRPTDSCIFKISVVAVADSVHLFALQDFNLNIQWDCRRNTDTKSFGKNTSRDITQFYFLSIAVHVKLSTIMWFDTIWLVPYFCLLKPPVSTKTFSHRKCWFIGKIMSLRL